MLLIIDIMRGKRIFQTELRGRRIEISMHMKLVKTPFKRGAFSCLFWQWVYSFKLILYPMNDIVRNWSLFTHLDKYSVDLLFVGTAMRTLLFDTAKIGSTPARRLIWQAIRKMSSRVILM